jgi:hypothetical protein
MLLARAALVLLALTGASSTASAGQKVAVFPFDMVFPKSEEDFYVGATGPSQDEQRRLELVQKELANLITVGNKFEVADLSGLAQDVTAASPIYTCNGCEVDLAGKAKADLAMTSVIDKISETHLSLTIAIVDVAKSTIVRMASVLIQGNTDEAWLHGVRWLVKNRLLAGGAAQ